MDPQRRNKADVTLALFSVCADDKSLRFLEKNTKKISRLDLYWCTPELF